MNDLPHASPGGLVWTRIPSTPCADGHCKSPAACTICWRILERVCKQLN